MNLEKPSILRHNNFVSYNIDAGLGGALGTGKVIKGITLQDRH